MNVYLGYVNLTLILYIVFYLTYYGLKLHGKSNRGFFLMGTFVLGLVGVLSWVVILLGLTFGDAGHIMDIIHDHQTGRSIIGTFFKVGLNSVLIMYGLPGYRRAILCLK